MAVMKDLTMTSFVAQIKAHVWPATRLALANYCGLKDNAEAVVNANTNILKEIHVSFVPSPHVDEPLPGPLDIELERNPGPMRQLPRYDIPIAPEPEPKPIAPRTELDIPGATTPWYKKPLTGQLRQGPIMDKKRNDGWTG